MYAPVTIGSCGNQSSHFKNIFQVHVHVIVDQHGQVTGDSMTLSASGALAGAGFH